MPRIQPRLTPPPPCDLLCKVTGAKAAFKAAGKAMPPLRYKCVNRIPYARGMGSSSAAIIAGLIGGLVLAGHKLPMWGAEELLQLACEIEVCDVHTCLKVCSLRFGIFRCRFLTCDLSPFCVPSFVYRVISGKWCFQQKICFRWYLSIVAFGDS